MRRLIFILLLLVTAKCFALQKNTASQKWVVFAFDITDNTAKTGDALNITANVRIDGAAADALDDVNPTELEDGYYVFDITAIESNGDCIVICPASTTGSIQVIGCPMSVWTTPANFPATSIDSNGRVDLIKIAGTTQTANDNGLDINTLVTGVNVIQIDGQATNGNNATLNLKQLNIVNSAGSAVIASATGGNGHGFELSGNGTGDGISTTGGATGQGLDAIGGSSTGSGIRATGPVLGNGLYVQGNNGHGLFASGHTAGDGIYAVGGATGRGIQATGGVTSGAGIYANAQANNDAGMELVKNGTGKDLDADETDAILLDTGTDGVLLAGTATSAQLVTDVWAKAMSDLAAGVPSATASVLTAINYLYEAWRNQTWSTATEIMIYKDNAIDKLVESTISDDATTFKRGEMRAPD